MMSDQTMKLNNRQTWRDQINVKRQQVAAEMVEGIFCFVTSLVTPSLRLHVRPDGDPKRCRMVFSAGYGLRAETVEATPALVVACAGVALACCPPDACGCSTKAACDWW